MNLSQQTVSVIGGSGFLGSYIVQAFASQGARVKVISRNPADAEYLKTMGSVSQVILLNANINDEEALKHALTGSDIVINAVGILAESHAQRFHALHAQGAEKAAKLAKSLDVKRFIQISALAVDKAVSSRYARTKINGEKAVLSAFPDATIIRPSVIFGPEDQFFNKFAAMTLFPFMPLIAAHAKFQPVYVADVAQAVLQATLDTQTKGKTYQLGGPEIVTFKELLTFIMDTTKQPRPFIKIPRPMAKLMSHFLKFMPTPPLTPDQMELLKTDNVVDKDAQGFEALGITPHSFKPIVAEYLGRFRPQDSLFPDETT